MSRLGCIAICLAAACTGDIDEAWQLDHDRVIAIRSTPPRIAANETAVLDALLGRKGAPPAEVDPDTAEVVSPSSLASALRRADHWTVTAPDEPQLVAARTELALADGAPVPLRVRFTFSNTGRVAYKNIWLGEHADNPILGPITIDGADAIPQATLTVAPARDIRLAVDFDETYDVNWLTSCGTMHDFDLPSAYLRVEADDPRSGQLVLVVRDATGGVNWQVWTIEAR